MAQTPPTYEPTPEEIAASCEEIQSDWTEKTRNKRDQYRPDSWLPPIFKCEVPT